MTGLQPSTKYYVMAYARNLLGPGYGGLDSFTTSPAVPVISAVPGTLDFGEVTYNTSAPVLSYKLSAAYLSSSSGVINVTATNSYTISTTYNGTYASTLNIPYSGGALANKIIYVKSPNTPYGSLSGMITHTGGGAVPPNADTVFLKTAIVQSQDTLTNKGTDFWCGFGYHSDMDSKANASDAAKMSLYIARR